MDQGIRKKYKTKVKLVAGILFVAVYVALFLKIKVDRLDSVLTPFAAPIIVLYTILMFGAGIVVLWKRKKTLWWRVMIGYGFYMIISIVNAVEDFMGAEFISRLFCQINQIFVTALLISLLVYAVRITGNLREKWLNISGCAMLWIASMVVFMVLQTFFPFQGEQLVVGRGENLWGNYLIVERESKGAGIYKRYIYCDRASYLNVKQNETQRMDVLHSTIFPISQLSKKPGIPHEFD